MERDYYLIVVAALRVTAGSVLAAPLGVIETAV
jgi:hypothetical protein